jgi:hypothetical protein
MSKYAQQSGQNKWILGANTQRRLLEIQNFGIEFNQMFFSFPPKNEGYMTAL